MFLFSTACAHGAAQGTSPQDQAALQGLVTAQAEAWNQGDAAAWSKDFTEDATFINIVGTVFEGRAQIEERHAAIFATVFKGSRTQVTVQKILFPEANIAVVDAVHEVTGHSRLPPGVQNTEAGLLRTRMRYVMKKGSGQWRIVAGQNTDVKPAP
ncbi:SgcJ/EcaC family oxidoreductase [Stigmatella aurantiaca]|uniref:SgcJ/EcaC family oxidoreductase n=1 Tax=Stigmatella aurantiaca TaxID=41 RepID=UPI003CCC3DD2